MHNYKFRVFDGKVERNIYVMESDYATALDKLFKNNMFVNYEFQGVVGEG